MKIDISQMPDELPPINAGEYREFDISPVKAEDGLRGVGWYLTPEIADRKFLIKNVLVGKKRIKLRTYFLAPSLEKDQEFTLKFSAVTNPDENGIKHRAEKDIKIVVKAGKGKVTAISNDVENAFVGQEVVLDASESFSTNGDIARHYWRQIEGPFVEIVDNETPVLEIKVPSFDPDNVDLYTQDWADELHKTPTGATFTTPVSLQNKFDIEYLGAFTANSAEGEGSADFAPSVFGVSEDNKSLFVNGSNQSIAEMKMPESFGFDPDMTKNPKAEVLQSYASIKDKESEGTKPYKGDMVNGIFHYKDKLFVTSAIAYDTKGGTPFNFRVVENAKDIANSAIKGYMQLEGRTKSAGWMSEIPDDMKAELGATHLSGYSSNTSVDNRHSVGPTLYTWNAETVLKNLTEEVISAHPWMRFGLANRISPRANEKDSTDPACPIWGLIACTHFGFIVPNTRKYLCFGTHGGFEGGIGYKIRQVDGGPRNGGEGAYQKGDECSYYWLFDMDEILNADEPYNVKPEAYGKFMHPYFENENTQIRGGAFNTLTNTLYLRINNTGNFRKNEKRPSTIAMRITPKTASSEYPDVPKRLAFECIVEDEMGYKAKAVSRVYLSGEEVIKPPTPPEPIEPVNPPIEPPIDEPEPRPPYQPPVEPIDPPIDEPDPIKPEPVIPPIVIIPELPIEEGEYTVGVSGTLTFKIAKKGN